jgi:hypothetical protein
MRRDGPPMALTQPRPMLRDEHTQEFEEKRACQSWSNRLTVTLKDESRLTHNSRLQQ